MDELTCPQCGNRMRYNFEQSKIMCPNCGYSPLDARQEEVKAQRACVHTPRLANRGKINIHAQTAFRTAHDHLHHGNSGSRRWSISSGHWCSRPILSKHTWGLPTWWRTKTTKRKHLSEVIAIDPGNGEALRRSDGVERAHYPGRNGADLSRRRSGRGACRYRGRRRGRCPVVPRVRRSVDRG